MNHINLLTLILVILALSTSSFFSGIETGLISLNRVRLRHLADEGDWRALILWSFLERPERLLATVLIGNWVSNVIAPVLVTDWLVNQLGSAGQWISLLGMSFVLLLLGDTVPKSLFRQYPTRLCLALAMPMQLSYTIFSPLVHFAEQFSQKMMHWLGIHQPPVKLFVTREELKLLAQESEQSGALSPEERRMVASVFEFTSLTARDIMVQIANTTMVTRSTPVTEILRLSKQRDFSRLPVVDESVKIIGLINVYDLLFSPTDPRGKTAEQCLRTALFVPANEQIDRILQKLRANRQPLAIVTDAQGKDLGVISLEDIVSRIVGEIES